jgi:hypothetical protein
VAGILFPHANLTNSYSTGAVGGRFTRDHCNEDWYTESGKLSGLGGVPVEMPEHFR